MFLTLAAPNHLNLTNEYFVLLSKYVRLTPLVKILSLGEQWDVEITLLSLIITSDKVVSQLFCLLGYCGLEMWHVR